jgi:hypothetical protein
MGLVPSLCAPHVSVVRRAQGATSSPSPQRGFKENAATGADAAGKDVRPPHSSARRGKNEVCGIPPASGAPSSGQVGAAATKAWSPTAALLGSASAAARPRELVLGMAVGRRLRLDHFPTGQRCGAVCEAPPPGNVSVLPPSLLTSDGGRGQVRFPIAPSDSGAALCRQCKVASRATGAAASLVRVTVDPRPCTFLLLSSPPLALASLPLRTPTFSHVNLNPTGRQGGRRPEPSVESRTACACGCNWVYTVLSDRVGAREECRVACCAEADVGTGNASIAAAVGIPRLIQATHADKKGRRRYNRYTLCLTAAEARTVHKAGDPKQLTQGAHGGGL